MFGDSSVSSLIDCVIGSSFEHLRAEEPLRDLLAEAGLAHGPLLASAAARRAALAGAERRGGPQHRPDRADVDAAAARRAVRRRVHGLDEALGGGGPVDDGHAVEAGGREHVALQLAARDDAVLGEAGPLVVQEGFGLLLGVGCERLEVGGVGQQLLPCHLLGEGDEEGVLDREPLLAEAVSRELLFHQGKGTI